MTILLLSGSFGAGIVLGLLYFGGLWWNTRHLLSGGRLRTMVLAMLARFVLLGAALTLASLEGALPLLLMALGVFIARPIVASRVRAP